MNEGTPHDHNQQEQEFTPIYNYTPFDQQPRLSEKPPRHNRAIVVLVLGVFAMAARYAPLPLPVEIFCIPEAIISIILGFLTNTRSSKVDRRLVNIGMFCSTSVLLSIGFLFLKKYGLIA